MLIELSIMLFVFFLSAALCLNMFARSEEISKESEARDRAVILSQNAAELLLGTNGDIEYVIKILGESAKECGLSFKIIPVETDSVYLGKAEITVFFEEKPVFTSVAAWQEVTADE